MSLGISSLIFLNIPFGQWRCKEENSYGFLPFRNFIFLLSQDRQIQACCQLKLKNPYFQLKPERIRNQLQLNLVVEPENSQVVSQSFFRIFLSYLRNFRDLHRCFMDAQVRFQ